MLIGFSYAFVFGVFWLSKKAVAVSRHFGHTSRALTA